jgi:hypothetical protein
MDSKKGSEPEPYMVLAWFQTHGQYEQHFCHVYIVIQISNQVWYLNQHQNLKYKPILNSKLNFKSNLNCNKMVIVPEYQSSAKCGQLLWSYLYKM